MDKRYVVKITTTNGKTRYFCYNDGSGYNTTFFIDSAARLTKEEAEKELLNFNNGVVALFAEEKKQRFVEAEAAIKRLEEKKIEEPVNNRYAELEQFWGKDKPTEHIVNVKPIEIKVKTEEKKPKQYNIDAISYEIKNIIKSLSRIDEFLTK